MPRDIDHIAVVVESIEGSLPLYTQVLGFRVKSTQEVPHMFVRVCMLESEKGGTHVELVQPTSGDSGVAKFLRKKGEGIHHVCLLVDDLSAELQRLQAHGIRLIDREPRRGEGNSLVAFLHPESCHGILIELKQLQADSPGSQRLEGGMGA
jgi:methylmalonyl-CoA epimerase